MTATEVVGRILSEVDASVRVLYFGALLAREAGLGPEGMVIVGGSAIEIYTRGGYVSGDIDLVADKIRVQPVLESWGFRKTGRVWVQADWKIVVDIVRRYDAYHGSLQRTEVVLTPYGGVRVEAVEDAMVRRLISSRYWQQSDDFDLAVAVATTHAEDIDWSYAEEIATTDRVLDLLTLLHERVRPRLP